MKLSEKTDNLMPALAAAYEEMGAATKDSQGHNYRYADAASVDAASRPVLAKHGLMYTQGVVEGLGGLAMETTIIHGASAQFISQVVPFIVPRGKTEDPQAYGSALTYSRRYGLQSALGMISDDDDGEAASRIARRPAPVLLTGALPFCPATEAVTGAPPAPGEDSGAPEEQAEDEPSIIRNDLRETCAELGLCHKMVDEFSQQTKQGRGVRDLPDHDIIGLKAYIIENQNMFKKETA